MIKVKESIQEPDNPSKRAKEDSIIDERNIDYRGDTNEKTRESDYSPSDTDGCARNLGDEHKNEEYEE